MTILSSIKEWIAPNKEQSRTNIGRNSSILDIGEVKGQERAKSALLLAAAGNHNLLMIGSPGEGKTTLAKTINSFLPSLSIEQKEILDYLYSFTSNGYSSQLKPFQSVHHSTTITSLLGGYNSQAKEITPGLVSLASFGILFLDELTEFSNDQLEALRQPISDPTITITRSQGSKVFPSQFQLIAASNPCKCGYFGTPYCKCSSKEVQRYLKRLSGPILDRIDIFTTLFPLSSQERLSKSIEGQSKQFLAKVLNARMNQYNRQGFGLCNAQLGRDVVNKCLLSVDAIDWLKIYMDREKPFSTRRMLSLCKVARTLADIINKKEVQPNHLQYSLQYTNRPMEL